MIKKLIRRSYHGIAMGGIVTFIALTIINFTGVPTSVSKIWLYMLSSFIIGIYFSLSSVIFMDNDWSILKQTIVHFVLSIIVVHSIGITVGWVPLKFSAILVSLLIFIGSYIIHWLGIYLYYKKLTESMNNDLKKR